MLKDLVRGRLLAAADEIFGLFQSTIASYEEQLLRAREESERQRRQLEAFSKTRLVSHVPDAPGPMGHQAQQVPPQLQGAPAGSEHTQLLQVKEEEGATAVPTKGEQAPREWQHVMTETKRRRGAAPPLAPLSDSDDVEELLRSGTDSEEELEGSSSLPHVQLGRIKQEEEKEESSISEMLLSGAPAKSEDDDKSPDWSPLEHQSPTPRGRSHASARAGEKPLSRSRRIHLVARMRKRGGAGSEAAHRVAHAPAKPFVRPLCGKISSRQQNVGEDMRAQPEDSFPRSVCQKRFAHKATLEGHMRAHASEPAFTCSFCGKTFSREASLAAHAQIHAGGKAFACALCGRRFCVQANMAAHVKTHRSEKLLS